LIKSRTLCTSTVVTVLQRGSNKIFSVSIVKISRPTLNKDVLDTEWALTSVISYRS